MDASKSPLGPAAPFAQRLRYWRERSGKSRAVVGGLVGRSADWVKGLETGRLEMPRLPKLIRLAEVLELDDLADLVGDQRVSKASYTKNAHASLDTIREALASYPVRSSELILVDSLATRVVHAWSLWRSSHTERDAIAPMLPGLLAEGHTAVRTLDGDERREAARLLAQIYHLAQMYCAFQPAPELVYMTSDRGMLAAQDADDPVAMAGAAWYLNHVWRDAGTAAEARVELATDMAGMLHPARSDDQGALYALMHLALALSHAKLGHEGDAWQNFDEAEKASKAVNAGRVRWPFYDQSKIVRHAVTIHLDLQKPGLALQAARKFDPAAIANRTNRAWYLIEVARAYHRQRDDIAAVHLLRKAQETSADRFAFSLPARTMVAELMPAPAVMVASDVREMARSLHLIS